MTDVTGFLPGLSPVAGKPVHVSFDGGHLTSDAGVLLLAEVERRLGLPNGWRAASRTRRDPERIRHGIAEMIRFRALLIAAGYPDANDCDTLRAGPGLQDGGRPAARERRRSLLAADHVPSGEPALAPGAQADDGGNGRAVLRQLRRAAAAHRARYRRHRGQRARRPAAGAFQCPLRQPLLPAHPYLRGDSAASRSRSSCARARRRTAPRCARAAPCRAPIRARWPRVDILVRGDSHYGRPEAMTWCERNRVGYIFGLAGNKVLLAQVTGLAEDAAMARLEARTAPRCAATPNCATPPRAGAARAPGRRPGRGVGPGRDCRFVVTNLDRLAAVALRGRLLRQGPGREPDQGA